jgi:prophage regulatory protein
MMAPKHSHDTFGADVLTAKPHAAMPVSSRVLPGPGSDAAGVADRTVTAHASPSSVAEHRVTGARVLRLPQVCNRVGLCRSMIYRLESEGRFPRRIKLGIRAVGWIESEVESWIRERAEHSGNDMRTETR